MICGRVMIDGLRGAWVTRIENEKSLSGPMRCGVSPLLLRALVAGREGTELRLSVPMIKLCAAPICLPLQIIFQNIIDTGIFPDKWKEANVTPVHKKQVHVEMDPPIF